jgi:hypothetical protein
MTLKPRENKSLAVAQSGPECGGIATFDAANGTLTFATMLRAERKPWAVSGEAVQLFIGKSPVGEPVANRGFQRGLRLL